MNATTVTLPRRPSRRGEAPWEVIASLPRQGEWTIAAYRSIEFEGPLVELSHGCLEVLPMPDWLHQAIAVFLLYRLNELRSDGRPGRVVLPPFNLYTVGKQYRHPDLMFLLPANADRFRGDYWDYADLVVEVISDTGNKADRDRDLIEKRVEYAAAGIPEYWIVDPAARTILVLALDGTAYREAGLYAAGATAVSVAMPGFGVDVARMFAEAEPTPP